MTSAVCELRELVLGHALTDIILVLKNVTSTVCDSCLSMASSDLRAGRTVGVNEVSVLSSNSMGSWDGDGPLTSHGLCGELTGGETYIMYVINYFVIQFQFCIHSRQTHY